MSSQFPPEIASCQTTTTKSSFIRVFLLLLVGLKLSLYAVGRCKNIANMNISNLGNMMIFLEISNIHVNIFIVVWFLFLHFADTAFESGCISHDAPFTYHIHHSKFLSMFSLGYSESYERNVSQDSHSPYPNYPVIKSTECKMWLCFISYFSVSINYL